MSIADFTKNALATGMARKRDILPPPAMPRPMELMPFSASDITNFTGEVGPGTTVSIDTAVLFNGRPTIRIDIPAGSTNVRVGTGAVAKVSVPYQWDLKNLSIAVRSTNRDMLKTMSFYLGDTANTNFWNTSFITGKYGADGTPSQWVNGNEWWIPKAEAALGVGAGTPALADKMRAKIWFNGIDAANSPTRTESIWIGMVGVIPKKKKPTIIFELDDGFTSWYDFIAPLARYYDLPVTMNLNTNSIDGASLSYLRSWQVKELHNDPSRLFDMCNHAHVHVNYSTAGAAALYDSFVQGRDKMRELGIDHDGPLHATYPNFQWGNDLLKMLKDGGFKTGRAGAGRVTPGQSESLMDQMIYTGEDKAQFILNSVIALGSGAAPFNKSVADAQTAVTNVITAGGALGMINAHNFDDVGGDYTWLKANMRELMGWVAAQRDLGNIEVKSRSRWYADLMGLKCDRR